MPSGGEALIADGVGLLAETKIAKNMRTVNQGTG
jgi:hypothetical protein